MLQKVNMWKLALEYSIPASNDIFDTLNFLQTFAKSLFFRFLSLWRQALCV